MPDLRELREILDQQEELGLSRYATKSRQAIRRRYDERINSGIAKILR